jgi:Tol biopolymer transport system component
MRKPVWSITIQMMFISLLLSACQSGPATTVAGSPAAIATATLTAEPAMPLIDSYLGQTPPGDKAVLFAPGVVSVEDRFEGGITFSPDGKEIYIGTFNGIRWTWGTILYARYENNQWSDFHPVPFLGTDYFDLSPRLSPDGLTFIFSSARPFPTAYSAMDLWMSRKSGDGWEAPGKLSDAINAEGVDESTASIAMSGAIYFQKDNTQTTWVSEYQAGTYSDAVLMDQPINSDYGATGPFISPDESYIIFSSGKPEGFGEADLYISYKKAEGGWTEPQNLGPMINGPDREGSPTISPDGKYLFFTRSMRAGYSDIYWVSASFLVRP